MLRYFCKFRCTYLNAGKYIAHLVHLQLETIQVGLSSKVNQLNSPNNLAPLNLLNDHRSRTDHFLASLN